MKRIETKRLILRSWRQEDLNDLHACAGSPLVCSMVGWQLCSDIRKSRVMKKR